MTAPAYYQALATILASQQPLQEFVGLNHVRAVTDRADWRMRVKGMSVHLNRSLLQSLTYRVLLKINLTGVALKTIGLGIAGSSQRTIKFSASSKQFCINDVCETLLCNIFSE